MFNLQLKDNEDQSPDFLKKVFDEYQDGEDQQNLETELSTSFHVMGSLKTNKQARLETG